MSDPTTVQVDKVQAAGTAVYAAECARLVTENTALRADLARLQQERDALTVERDRMAADAERYRCDILECPFDQCPFELRAMKAEAALVDLMAKVRALPNPWKDDNVIAYDPDGDVEIALYCLWCRYSDRRTIPANEFELLKPIHFEHPDNGCLALLRSAETGGQG